MRISADSDDVGYLPIIFIIIIINAVSLTSEHVYNQYQKRKILCFSNLRNLFLFNKIKINPYDF